MGFISTKGFPGLNRGFTNALPSISIPNAGWETGTAGGWTLLKNGTALLDVVGNNARSGTYCLYAQPKTGSCTARYSHLSYAKYIGYTVVFSVWAKRENGNEGQIQLDDNTQNPLTLFNWNDVGSGVYKQFTVEITVAALATRLFFLLTNFNSNFQNVWMDDMQVRIKS